MLCDDLEEDEDTEEETEGEGETSRGFPFCLFFEGVLADGDDFAEGEELSEADEGKVVDDDDDRGRGGGLAAGLTVDFP